MLCLAELKDLVQRLRQNRAAKKIEQHPQYVRVAWVRCRDATREKRVSGDEPRLQGVVDPLPDSHEEHAEKEQQRVPVVDRLQIEHQRCCRTCGAAYDEDLVPVIELEPGWELVHVEEHSTAAQGAEPAGQEAA